MNERFASLSPFAKQMLLALATGLFSILVSWTAFARSVPTKTEVIELIRQTSPYNEDRKLLMASIESTSRKLDKISDDLSSLKVDTARMAVVVEAVKVAAQLRDR